MVRKKLSNKEVIAKLEGEIGAIKKEIQRDVVGPVVASFGFIIALVWRDAIKASLDEYLIKMGLLDKAYLYNFISAIIVTCVVIVIMIMVTRFGRSKTEKRIEKKIKEVKKKL